MEENKIMNEEVKAAEEIKIEEPAAAEKPACEEPAAEKCAPEEPAAEKAACEEPAAENAACEEPACDAAAEEPACDTAAEDAAAEEVNEEEEAKKFADETVAKLKEMYEEGKVTRIRIRKGKNIILDLPMTVGLLGAVVGLVAAPWAVILGAISTVGFKCTVEVEDKDGNVTVVHGKES